MSSNPVIRIDSELIDQMIDHAEQRSEECCGFLFGHNDESRFVTEILAAANVTGGNKLRQFEIHPLEYLKAENYAEKNNLELLGIYHSHPDHPAVPSESDRVAAQTDFSYVILSVLNKQFSGMRSWRLNSDRLFIEEKINPIS